MLVIRQNSPDRVAKAREAFRLTNDLMLDLIAASKIHLIMKKFGLRVPQPESVRIGINRLCLSHVMITLAKWCELYDRYKAVIPAASREAAKQLTVDLKERGIPTYRNVVVGHVWDRETGRPLTVSETELRLAAITKSDIEGFLRWINDSPNNEFPKTVVSIVERVRDTIQNEYSFTTADLGL